MYKLEITDTADPMVGMFKSVYNVDCPFDDDEDEDEKLLFKELIEDAYKQFALGKIKSEYIKK